MAAPSQAPPTTAAIDVVLRLQEADPTADVEYARITPGGRADVELRAAEQVTGRADLEAAVAGLRVVVAQCVRGGTGLASGDG
ncbi:MAG: hypothetical protein ACTHXO_00860 [Actinomycetaceae bacterium]